MADKLYGHEKYTDVTEEFTTTCKQSLKEGEIVKRPGFTLFEGIHALEIGHRQMDTGLIFKSLPEQLEQAPQTATAKQALELIDLLFSREMSWHNGPMLIQNFFSSVYVEKVLNEIKSAKIIDDYLNFNVESWSDVVKVYILATLKSIDTCINQFAESSAVYPEEDVILERCTFDLLTVVPKEKLSSMLEKAKLYISRNKSDDSSQLSYRLSLRQHLLKILGTGVLTDTTAAMQVFQKIVPCINKESEFNPTFTEFIQSRIDNPYPLRPLTSVPVNEAYESLEAALNQMQEIRSTLGKISRATDRMSYIVSFASKRPRPLPVVRALLASTMKDAQIWLHKDIKEVIGPDALDSRNSAVIQFYEDASLCYEDTLLSLCQNRARQHRNLSHAIVSWDSLQVLAETIEDQETHPDMLKLPNGQSAPSMPLTSWVLMRKLQVMIWTVLLGFELELYEPWEFPSVLVYAHSLIGSNKNHLGQIRLYLQQKMQKYKRRGGSILIEYDQAHRYVGALELEAMGLDQLAQASLYLAIAFDKKGFLTLPKNALTFTSRKLLHDTRMKPFSSVGNPPATQFEESRKLVDNLTLELALGLAKNMSGSSRSVFDHLKKMSGENPEVALLTRSALGISIMASMLEKMSVLSDDRTVISKSEGYHWYFPVLSVVPKESRA